MPPQPGKSISSYFTKLPATPRSSTASATRPIASPSLPTTPSKAHSGADAASTSPLTALGSSPPAASHASGSASASASANGKKRAGLSEAARQAIRDAAKCADGADNEDARASKKIKLGTGGGAPVADVFKIAAGTKTAAPPGSSANSRPATVRSDSREALKQALGAHPHPHTLELLRTEVDTMGEDWLLALQDELTKPYFLTLKEFVTAQQASKKVFPPNQDIYSWSRLCPLKDVRVVIIGQDPYHDDGQAHGLAFSVRKGVRIPPSLRNIYKQMHTDEPRFVIPKHGDLTEWAKHGVLLLNTSLTVRAHEAGSHAGKGWEQFTAAVLRVVTARLAPDAGAGGTGSTGGAGGAGVCFMAWGAHAQKMCAGVDSKKHMILKSAHPSPLAASRGFFGNGHFVKANAWLEERYGPGGGVDWAALGEQ